MTAADSAQFTYSKRPNTRVHVQFKGLKTTFIRNFELFGRLG